MTAPLALRDYFAAVGSPFSTADAQVIGPQIAEMAEGGAIDTKNDDAARRTIVDTARSTNSPLNRFFEWDDAKAADLHRLDHAGKMLRSIRVRFVQDDRPRTTPAYRIARPQAKPTFSRGHNVLHGDSAAAVQKARDAFDELTSWRARYAPFVIVWQEFAAVFRGVANQIAEAEEVVNVGGLDDRTDLALTELQPIMASLTAWREKHGTVTATWADAAEQAAFVCEAIDALAEAFTRDQKGRERPCLRCGKAFLSAGLENRLCEACRTA